METLLNLSHGIDTALTRGWLGCLETMGLVSGAPIAFIRSLRIINRNINTPGLPHERYTNATFQLILPTAFMGAIANGVGQYTQPTYQSFLNHLPLVNLPQSQDIQAYLTRLMDGGIIGSSVVTLPYLLYLGQRHGVYGRVGRGVWIGTQNAYNYAAPRVQNAANALYHNVRHFLHI